MELKGRRAILLCGALLLSLCVNGLAAGVLLAERAERGPGRGPPAPAEHVFLHGLRGALDDLPADRAERLRAALKADWRAMRGDFREMRQLRRQIVEALDAETVDTAALETLLTESRIGQDRIHANLHRLLLQIAPDVPAEVRHRILAPTRERMRLRDKERAEQAEREGEEDGPDAPPER